MIKKITIVALLTLLFLISCSKKSNNNVKKELINDNNNELNYLSQKKESVLDLNSFLPSKIKIVRDGGISVRNLPGAKGEIKRSVYKNDIYNVISGRPIYYKIIFLDQEGWIGVNPEGKWTEINNNGKVTVLLKGGITIRTHPYKKGEVLGVAAIQSSFDLLDIRYSYLEIELPNGETGWIYIGNDKMPWVARID